MNYTQGEEFRLKVHNGMFSDHPLKGDTDIVNPLTRHEDAAYETFLDRHHPLFAGQVGHVVEVGEMGDPPVEHVYLAFDHLDQATKELIPNKQRGRAHRITSFTQEQMDEWFEPLNANFFSAEQQEGWRDSRPWVPKLSAEPPSAIENAMQADAALPEEKV